MAGFDLAFLQLLFRLCARQTGQISTIDFTPQKPHFVGDPIPQPFERATPESQGVSSEHVRQYLEALKNDPEANPHHAIILRHGKIIAECAFAPYQRGMWHITHSMCKSFTGMAVGLAVHEGLFTLDDKLDDIFPQYIKLLSRFGRKEVTIRHLLTMTSGVDFGEARAISGNDWRTGFMSANVKFEPGTQWEYNSMNSYMLSAVIQEKTGETMFEYLKKRVFDPLGIKEVFWEKCPMGVTKGGWGMFIRPEDACKLGQLYLDMGRWKGKQIIPEEWVRDATRKEADNGKYGYGYQLWMEERPGGYAYNGLFGQDVVIYPDDDMIIMINAGNREMTQSGSLTEIMRRYWGIGYFPSDEPLPEDTLAREELESRIAEYEGRKPAGPVITRGGWFARRKKSEIMTPEELMAELKGCSFKMEAGTTGIFPLICQVMHYNFTDGISQVSFDEIDGQLMVLFYEGKDIHHVRVGFDKAAVSEIMLHGEPYYIGTKGRIATDENDRIVLLLDITFIEEACTRKINFYFGSDTIEMRANETPDEDVIADAIQYTGDNPDFYRLPIIKNIIAEGGMNLVNIAIQSAIHPTDIGHLIHE